MIGTFSRARERADHRMQAATAAAAARPALTAPR